MEAKNLIAVTGCILLAACAVHPLKSTAVAQTTSESAADAEIDGGPFASRADLPNQELTARVLYQLLLAEIAGQRDQPQLAASTYLDVAKSTRDPRIAQRATEVALSARQPRIAADAAKLWADLDPSSRQAQQTVVAVLVSEGRFDESKPWISKILAGADPAAQGQSFLHLNSLLARQADKQAVLAFVQNITEPYPKLAESHYSIALAAYNAGRKDLALTEVRKASELRPGWEGSALMEGQILQTEAPDDAVTFYRDFLKKHPQAREVQLNFARFLVDRKDFTGAREQFGQILKAAPDNPELTLAVGLLSMQLQDFDYAEEYLEKVLSLNYKDPDAVRMYLGQLNEERKSYEKAEEWYRAVQPGEQYLPAQIKVATLLARRNQLAEARKFLADVKPENNQQRTQVVIAESQILRDAKQYQEAYDTLTKGLEQMPDTADLLYDRAMVSEKLERLDLLESDLRLVIKLKPDHAHAYNALGYTLADRTTRYGEAKELIEKAIALSPSDPFIIDSLGWVQYRMGNLSDAALNLRSAYDKAPDPEIAAHLGEVLWAQGQKDEARRLVMGKLKDNPDNEILQALAKKFTP
jgi:tetratricopeptide (TPR) repeat protein